MSERILIVGATSGIARAAAYEYARHGHNLVLAGRDAAELEVMAADLHLRHGVEAVVRLFDALDYGAHPSFFASCHERQGGDLHGMILCHGYLGDQRDAEENFDEARRMIEINFLSYVSLLHLAADYFAERQTGFICALSSVAGDRGRQSNYVYGAAKGGLSLLLQGHRNRLHPKGVTVITAKPGFVDTGMTYGLLKGGPLLATPEQVAGALYRAIGKRRELVYLPWFWWAG